jgi:hypothetical protein
VSCRDVNRGLGRKWRTAVAAELLTNGILGAAFRTAAANLRAAVIGLSIA